MTQGQMFPMSEEERIGLLRKNLQSDDDPRRRDAFTDYRIIDVDADSERDPHAIIASADYGLEFSVEEPKAERGTT